MSSLWIIISLLIVCAVLILMVSKLKCHAMLALFSCTILMAFLVGVPIDKIPSTINSGFGSTCTSVALIIFMGSLLGIVLSESGAIEKLTEALVKLFGEKNVILAVGVSTFLIRTITGSNTLGVSTAAALCAPMLGNLNITPLAAHLAMCAGAVAISHANSSVFCPYPV
ncbi:MAG: hypothetical protein LUC94_14765 [Clostridiales bacterium]|nr:hypothetical protein [Clostridiales bacterium]